MEFANGRTDILSDYWFDILIYSITKQKNRIREESIHVPYELAESLFSNNGAQMYIRSRYNVKFSS